MVDLLSRKAAALRVNCKTATRPRCVGMSEQDLEALLAETALSAGDKKENAPCLAQPRDVGHCGYGDGDNGGGGSGVRRDVAGASAKALSGDADFDALLEEVLDDSDSGGARAAATSVPGREPPRETRRATDRCGNGMPRGAHEDRDRGRGSTNGVGRESGLRCLDCDMSVLLFENCAWQDGAEYMFFRNHHPDCAKLAAMLRDASGMAAFCCQCKWQTSAMNRGASCRGDYAAWYKTK